MVNLEYDCIKWSTDKGVTSLYEWYPESPSISKLPDIYMTGPDGCTLFHKPTNTPLIIYENNEFRILTGITDWEMYIYLYQKVGTVTLADHIRVKIGAIVSKYSERQVTTIRGNATLIYHDSIWSQSSIVMKEVTIRGHEDGAHRDVSFIYCDNFAGENLDIEGVNRIYGKGDVILKNCNIRDEEDESRYISEETNMDKLPGMYLYAGLEMIMEHCNICIHNFIRGNTIQITNSEIHVNNLVSQHPCIGSVNRMFMDNAKVHIKRKRCSDNYILSPLVAVDTGDMIISHSEINLVNTDCVIKKYPCVKIGIGTIIMDSSTITATRYPRAIVANSYGPTFVNFANKPVDMDFEMNTNILNTDYRFKASVGTYTVWVYVKDKAVTDVELIKGNLQGFNAEVITKYMKDNFIRVRSEASQTEFKTEYVSACAYGDNPIHVHVL